jgi:hypothetical protein
MWLFCYCKALVDYHDEATLLHINHIDSAKIGRWKEDLSLEEVRAIENKVEQWCQANQSESSIFFLQ